MSIDLIPQDELTLDLLAEVLAKMYRFSLKSKAGGADEVADVGASMLGAESNEECRSHPDPERDLVRAKVT